MCPYYETLMEGAKVCMCVCLYVCCNSPSVCLFGPCGGVEGVSVL